MNLRKAAKGQPCHVRIPEHCNFDPETVVLSHDNLAGISGMGMKAPDVCAVPACSRCHDVIDGRTKTDLTKAEVKLMFYEGMSRWLAKLSKEGKI